MGRLAYFAVCDTQADALGAGGTTLPTRGQMRLISVTGAQPRTAVFDQPGYPTDIRREILCHHSTEGLMPPGGKTSGKLHRVL